VLREHLAGARRQFDPLAESEASVHDATALL
jgi:hypothetical protein